MLPAQRGPGAGAWAAGVDAALSPRVGLPTNAAAPGAVGSLHPLLRRRAPGEAAAAGASRAQ